MELKKIMIVFGVLMLAFAFVGSTGAKTAEIVPGDPNGYFVKI